MTDLKQMTVTQLKQYLSEERGDDDKFSEAFSEALSELLSRDRNPVIYPADMPLEEIDRVAKRAGEDRARTTRLKR